MAIAPTEKSSGDSLDPEENFKRLINELGDAINDSLSESQKTADAMERIRAAGYDLFLILEVTIGFNKQRPESVRHRQKVSAQQPPGIESPFTTQDAQFLRSLKIRVDEDLR